MCLTSYIRNLYSGHGHFQGHVFQEDWKYASVNYNLKGKDIDFLFQVEELYDELLMIPNEVETVVQCVRMSCASVSVHGNSVHSFLFFQLKLYTKFIVTNINCYGFGLVSLFIGISM